MLTRMLVMAGCVAAGAIAGVVGQQTGCPAALQSIALALGTLGGLSGNVLATDFHSALARRALSAKDAAVNHDILRAVGEAMKLVLEALAAEKEPSNLATSVVRAVAGGSDDARDLRAMAARVDEWWVAYAQNDEAKGHFGGGAEAPVTEGDVVGMVAKSAQAGDAGTAAGPRIPGVTYLDKTGLQNALRSLAAYAGVEPADELIGQAADCLYACVPWYLREVLKDDAFSGGKAYPALLLDMLGSILSSVAEIGPKLDDLSKDEAERHKEVIEAIGSLSKGAHGFGSQITAKLDPEQYKAILDRWSEVSKQYGTIVERLDSLAERLARIEKLLLGPQPASAAPTIAHVAEPRALHVYEPRDAEKAAIEAGMFRADDSFGPAALVGMAGVGKTCVAEMIAWEHRKALAGGMFRLELAPGQDPDAKALATDLCARFGVTVPTGMEPALALHTRLLEPLSMLLIENVDAHDQVAPVSALVQALPGVPALVTGRCATLEKKSKTGWVVRRIEPFDRTSSDSLLVKMLGDAATRVTDDDRRRLFEELGGVALAIRIAASHIGRIGGSASRFLNEYHKQRADCADAPGSEEVKDLRAAVMVSIAALQDIAGPEAVAALARMAFGPAAGMGADLARTVSGLDKDAFVACCASADELSLLRLRLREGDSGIEHVSFHPLVAEVLRAEGDQEARALDAMTDWFVARLPEGGDDQGERWRQIQAELPALERWLNAVPETRLRESERAGSWYARLNGPYRWWAPLFERLIASGDADDRSHSRLTLSGIQQSAGDLDAALATAKATLDEDTARGADREAALAAGLIADILQSRGDLDEALRIRHEEELPVYERLGDVRSRAVTMGKIADILQSRGDLDEALRIRREEELPVFERLGDVRERAVTMGKIADISSARGDYDTAIVMRREEHPAYERLGDI